MILDLGGGVGYVAGSYYGSVWGGGVGVAAPAAPPSTQQGGGTYLYRFPPSLLIPAVVEPRVYSHTGIVLVDRLRLGGRVWFLENRAIAEDEEIVALL